MRKLDGDQFSAKKPREWNDVGLLFKQRESWCQAVNEALEKAGRDERVSHLSLKAQGVDREPQPKIGVAATAMKRKGTLLDPERFQIVRKIKIANEALPFFKSIRQRGEVKQVKQRGVGTRWWEHPVTFMSRVREQTGQLFKSAWFKLIGSRGHDMHKDGPEIER